MDYYNILEINRNASQLDIKKAYKNLARIHHPDKNNKNKNNDTPFWKINEAYQTLSNKELKRDYDNKFNNNPDIFKNINKLFNNKTEIQSALLKEFIFNNIQNITNLDNLQDNMIHYFKHNFNSIISKYNIEKILLAKLVNSLFEDKNKLIGPEDINHTIKVTLEQIFLNKTKTIQVSRKIKCNKCNGSGTMIKCEKCNHNNNNNNIICTHCFHYKLVKEKCNCDKGHTTNTKIFNIPLNKSILNNTKLTFNKEGEYLNTWLCQGNMNIYINYKLPDNYKIINKIDITIEKLVSLYEWLYEYNFDYIHFDNNKINLSKTGCILKPIIIIKNKGLQLDNSIGNLYIILKLDIDNINKTEIYNKYKPLNICDYSYSDLENSETVGDSETVENSEIIDDSETVDDSENIEYSENIQYSDIID